jgi:hypothetical protein
MRVREQEENLSGRKPDTARVRGNAGLARPLETGRPLSPDGMSVLQRSAGNRAATHAVDRSTVQRAPASEQDVDDLKKRLAARNTYAGNAFARGRLFFDRFAGKSKEFASLSVPSSDGPNIYYRGMTEEEFTKFAASGRMEERDKGYQGLSPTRDYADKYVGMPGYLVRFELSSSARAAQVSIDQDIFEYTGVTQKPESGVMSYGLAKTAHLAQWVQQNANNQKWEWAKPGDAVKYFNAWLDTKMITWRLVKCNVPR